MLRDKNSESVLLFNLHKVPYTINFIMNFSQIYVDRFLDDIFFIVTP